MKIDWIFLVAIGLLQACTNIKAAGPDPDAHDSEDDEFDPEGAPSGGGGGGGDGDGGADTGVGTADTGDGSVDTGVGTVDTGDGSEDTAAPGVPLDGFGAISGDCGRLDLNDPGAQFWTNTLDLGEDAIDLDSFDASVLTSGGAEVLADGTFGGSSSLSEVFSFEVLARCERAELLKTETEIIYDSADSKKTDLLVTIGLDKVGVSVTRGFIGSSEGAASLTEDEALSRLTDKLADIPLSAEGVSDADEWSRSVLHIMALDAASVTALSTAYASLDSSVLLDTIVVITQTDGEDAALYDSNAREA
jgi:hypothetical protein